MTQILNGILQLLKYTLLHDYVGGSKWENRLIAPIDTTREKKKLVNRLIVISIFQSTVINNYSFFYVYCIQKI